MSKKKITLKSNNGEELYPLTVVQQVEGLQVALDEKLGKTEKAVSATEADSAYKLNVMSFRPTSANISTTDGGLYQFKATSNMTEGDPGKDGHIIHSSWDNSEWSSQIFLGADVGMSVNDRMKVRWQESGIWSDWKTVAFTDSTVASVIDGSISTSKIADTAITPAKIQTSIALNGTPSMTVEPTTSSPDKTIASVGLVKKAVDGIEVGGTNLILNSDFSEGTEHWSLWHNTGTLSVVDKVATFSLGDTQVQGVLQTSAFNIVSGEEYMVSFDVRSDNLTSLNYCYLMSSSGNIWQPLTPTITTTWQRIEYKFKATTTGEYMFGFGMSQAAGKSFQIKRVKVERGNKATDWSPAPEDVQKQLNDTLNDKLEGYASIQYVDNKVASIGTPGNATETGAGIVRAATQAEVAAGHVSDNDPAEMAFVRPETLQSKLSNYPTTTAMTQAINESRQIIYYQSSQPSGGKNGDIWIKP
ncbi:MAG: carbohydrate binding domain-containing protein [Flavobacteriales bacterium]|nr:carbohydrate binding domain-containing protein [Flavobacteriales bacterium]